MMKTKKKATFGSALLYVVIFCLSLQAEVKYANGQQVVEIPSCSPNEFLTANETDLFCSPLPDTRFCDCPDLLVLNNGTVVTPSFPLPPPGCPQFEPPTRGAFVCLRQPSVIFCTVLCDHRFEFFTTPHNPYSCGEITGFIWKDSTGATVQVGLPLCTGYRHRVQTLYRDELYLPSPCYGLSDNNIAAILREFHASLKLKVCPDCLLESTFLRCPSIAASGRLFTDLDTKSFHRK